ncbi:hypothetical protein NEAUS07_0996 [Nematocida ausubeli]|nr:hypothetical protein NEAUS07_0996 [Nematocida ausubeli]KAI5137225.1 hypothetical protein NEAUS06_2150 [Nematocida ausubeli]
MNQKDSEDIQKDETKAILQFVMKTIKQTIDFSNISKDTLEETVHLNILKIHKYISQNIPKSKVSTLDVLLYNIFLSYRRILKKKIDISVLIKKQDANITYLISNLKNKLKEMPIDNCKPSLVQNNSKSKTINFLEESEETYKNEYRNNSGKRMNYPKTITKILKSWLSTHMNNPYPDEVEKKYLIYKTGLGNTQINNWFINARRRILPKLFQAYHSDKKVNKI